MTLVVADMLMTAGVPHGMLVGKSVTTTAWLTESVDRCLRRYLRCGKYSAAIDYLIQRSMISHYVVAEFEESPWVVVHGDLHNGNILVDKDYDVCGIIDWDFTYASPVQKAAIFPKLLENVPGGAPPSVPEPYKYLDLKKDKLNFLTIFATKEHQLTGDTSLTQAY